MPELIGAMIKVRSGFIISSERYEPFVNFGEVDALHSMAITLLFNSNTKSISSPVAVRKKYAGQIKFDNSCSTTNPSQEASFSTLSGKSENFHFPLIQK